MADEVICRLCPNPIPPARLKAVPGTTLCVRCSEKTGGEFELEVTISTTGKAGSLKKTGQDVQAKIKRKSIK